MRVALVPFVTATALGVAACSSSPVGASRTTSSSASRSLTGSTGGASSSAGPTHYQCTIDGFRDGANGGSANCPSGCSAPTDAGSTVACDPFGLTVDGMTLSWDGCFTCQGVAGTLAFAACATGGCQTPAVSCTSTDQSFSGTFVVAKEFPFCGATQLATNQLFAGFPTNGAFSAICTLVGTSPPLDAGSNGCQWAMAKFVCSG